MNGEKPDQSSDPAYTIGTKQVLTEIARKLSSQALLFGLAVIVLLVATWHLEADRLPLVGAILVVFVVAMAGYLFFEQKRRQEHGATAGAKISEEREAPQPVGAEVKPRRSWLVRAGGGALGAILLAVISITAVNWYNAQPDPVGSERLDALVRAFPQNFVVEFASCTSLITVGSSIQPEDRKFMTSIHERALQTAKVCRGEIEASDGRLNAFLSAARNRSVSVNPMADETLVSSEARLTTFDRERFDQAHQGASRAAETAAERLRQSDQRTSRLVGILPLPSPPSAGLCESLTQEWEALPDYDRQRGAESLRSGLQVVRTCQTLLDESERRLKQLRQAAPADPSDARSQVILTEAFKALTPFDIDRIHSAEDHEAVALANAAMDRVQQSDWRLEALLSAWHKWKGSRSKLTIDRLLASSTTVTEFDHQRFTDNHRVAFAAGKNEMRRGEVRRASLTEATKQDVAIFVTGQDELLEQPVTPAFVKQVLASMGFRLTSSRQDADLVLTLQGTAESSEVTFATTGTFSGAVAKVSLKAMWVYDGAPFQRFVAEGNSAGASKRAVMVLAYEDAAAKTAEAFANFVSANTR